MRYLWLEPLRMDNSRLVAFLGAWKVTLAGGLTIKVGS
jgi:hypothetical protein